MKRESRVERKDGEGGRERKGGKRMERKGGEGWEKKRYSI